jgi:ribonuclease HI
MKSPAPHFVLVSETHDIQQPGRWRFVLRSPGGKQHLVADDVEPDARGERLELLSVIRGLEALDQPSKVTLVTQSAYVRKGIRFGLPEWRKNGWQWECFGEMVPVKNGDLWQRMDRALRYHQLECRTWRVDPAHGPRRKRATGGEKPHGEGVAVTAGQATPAAQVSALAPHFVRQLASRAGRLLQRMAVRR